MCPGAGKHPLIAYSRTYTRAPRLPSNVPIELYIKLALPVLKNFHRLPERATSPLEASPRTKNIFHHRLVEFPQAAAPWQEKFSFDTFRIVKDTSHVVLLRSKSPSSSSVTPVDKTCPRSPTLRSKVRAWSFEEFRVPCVCAIIS